MTIVNFNAVEHKGEGWPVVGVLARAEMDIADINGAVIEEGGYNFIVKLQVKAN